MWRINTTRHRPQQAMLCVCVWWEAPLETVQLDHSLITSSVSLSCTHTSTHARTQEASSSVWPPDRSLSSTYPCNTQPETPGLNCDTQGLHQSATHSLCVCVCARVSLLCSHVTSLHTHTHTDLDLCLLQTESGGWSKCVRGEGGKKKTGGIRGRKEGWRTHWSFPLLSDNS